MFTKKSKIQKFTNVILYGLAGVVFGILFGLVFGVLITWITTLIGSPEFGAPSIGIGAFLGMGAGAIICGIWGAIIGYKD